MSCMPGYKTYPKPTRELRVDSRILHSSSGDWMSVHGGGNRVQSVAPQLADGLQIWLHILQYNCVSLLPHKTQLGMSSFSQCKSSA